MFLVDSHCHLQRVSDKLGLSIPDILDRAMKEEVRYFLNVSVSLSDFPSLLETTSQHANVAISCGIHPNEMPIDVDEDAFFTFASHPKVIAIGETGLDYYRSQGDLSWQRERFKTHIRIAKTLGKPLIVHMRDAADDTIALMRESGAHMIGGIMHCFSENLSVAASAIDLGFYISFSGTVTFKNARSLQEVAKAIPLNRLLIETDAPYLAPTPLRGKINEPQYVRHTAAHIAHLRGLSLEALADVTTNNFFNLFKNVTRPHV